MIRPPSGFSLEGVCNVAMDNVTVPGAPPGIVLGMPFLRSVYVAYRFPTDDCPGYYGFAFPTSLNRTSSQIAQKPRSTPPLASSCLNLITPTSTPTPFPTALQAQKKLSPESYGVYAHEGEGMVPLVGWDELRKGVWDLVTGSGS
jgi:hypothetical protein